MIIYISHTFYIRDTLSIEIYLEKIKKLIRVRVERIKILIKL